MSTVQEILAKLKEQAGMGPAPTPAAPPPPPSGPAVSAPPPPAAPAPAVAAATPGGFWQPGDPLNDTQKFFVGQGKPLWVVASAADNPAPVEQCQAMPGAMNPYAPVPESGTVNPPHAPVKEALTSPAHAAAAFGVAAPAQSQAAAPEANPWGRTRDEAKAEAERLGLVASSSRLGQQSLEEMIAKHKATPPAPAAPAVAAPAAPAVAAPAAPAVAAPAAPVAGFVLYINTLPVRGGTPAVAFSQIAEEVRKALAASGIPEYGLVATGPALWCSSVEAFIGQNPGIPAIYVNTQSREGRDALPALERLASVVYQGVT